MEIEERTAKVIEDLGIRIRSIPGAEELPLDFQNCDPWTVTLNVAERKLTTPFFKGKGHEGKPPTAQEVIECLAMDSELFEDSQGFEDFCDNLGYDADSRGAEKIYKACTRTARKLKDFLGEEAYNFLLWGRDIEE